MICSYHVSHIWDPMILRDGIIYSAIFVKPQTFVLFNIEDMIMRKITHVMWRKNLPRITCSLNIPLVPPSEDTKLHHRSNSKWHSAASGSSTGMGPGPSRCIWIVRKFLGEGSPPTKNTVVGTRGRPGTTLPGLVNYLHKKKVDLFAGDV